MIKLSLRSRPLCSWRRWLLGCRRAGAALGCAALCWGAAVAQAHPGRDTAHGRAEHRRGPRHEAAQHGPRAHHSHAPARGFVQAAGPGLRRDGEPFRFAGTNNYYLAYKSPLMVDDVLEQAEAHGFSVVRTWAFIDIGTADGQASVSGKADGQVYYQYWNGSAPAFNDGPDGLQHLDYVIQRAGELGLHLILPLTNNWSDFGGMDQYVRWRGAQFHDDFYSDPTIRSWYKAWIRHVLERVNPLTGKAYKDDPTILGWELANEPRCAGSGVYPRSPGCGTGTLLAWADDISRFIKRIDARHLVSVGDEGFYCTPGASDWTENCGEGVDSLALGRLPRVDVLSYHLYPDGWGKSVSFGTDWIERHVADARAIGKPTLLGEFGLLDTSTRNPNYALWTNALFDAGGSGALYWMLAAHQDDGSLYPDFDGFTVYGGTPVARALSNFARMQAQGRRSSFAPVADHDVVYTLLDVPVSLQPLANDVSYGSPLVKGSLDLAPEAAGVQSVLELAEGRFEALVDGSVSFTPAPGFTGHVQTPYLISDRKGRRSLPAELQVEVAPPPEAALLLGSFEDGTDGWGTTWDSAAGTVSQSLDFATEGSHSLRIDANYGHWFGVVYGAAIDLSDKTHVSWDIHAEVGTSQQLAIQTGSAWDWCEGAVWQWVDGGMSAHLEVDLTTLSCGASVNLAEVHALYVFTGATGGGSFYLDGMRAE